MICNCGKRQYGSRMNCNKDCRGQQQEKLFYFWRYRLLFEGQTAGYAQVNNAAQESLQRLSGDYNVTEHVSWRQRAKYAHVPSNVAWLSGLYDC